MELYFWHVLHIEINSSLPAAASAKGHITWTVDQQVVYQSNYIHV